MTAAPDSKLAAHWVPSPNFEPRPEGRKPDTLILHYTGMEACDAARDWLASEESKVSAHYLLDEAGVVTQMVAESERAWHAGQSYWAGETDLNSASIGIEIHNPGHDFDYPPFPEVQMQAVEALCLDILGRHAIPKERVLAHSDIAPGRKRDPGERFDWARLARAGIGLWTEPVPLGDDAASVLATRARPSPNFSVISGISGTASRTRPHTGAEPKSWWRPSSGTTGPQGSTAVRTARPARR